MTRFSVLVPHIICMTLEDFQIYKQLTIDWKVFDIIDEVSYNGSAEDCRMWLINHDWFNPYIVCIPVEDIE